MLISMPTGTSTIFGVFQAILALLAKPDELRPRTNKLIGNEKFASEIFCRKTLGFHAAAQQEFTVLCGGTSNQSRINRFIVICNNAPPQLSVDLIRRIPDKELVSSHRLPNGSP
jgi:hypothetical protein